MSDNIILSLLLLFVPFLYGAAKVVIPKGFISPKLFIFRENPEISQARDKIKAVHLTMANVVATRGLYFFEIRHNDDFPCPYLLVSEFIQGRQHVFISHHLGMEHEFRSVSIYKDDIEGEYYILIFAKWRPVETNL